MTRIRTIAVLAAVAALALPGAALARKVDGGTTQLALSSAASNAMSARHLTVTSIAPATAGGSTFTFPISRGRLNSKLHGVVANRGGFKISNGSRAISVRHLEIVSSKRGVVLDALYPRTVSAHGARATHGTRVLMTVRHVGRVTAISVHNGSATGTVRLTKYSAGRINRLAGKAIAKAGTPIGTITITPTFG